MTVTLESLTEVLENLQQDAENGSALYQDPAGNVLLRNGDLVANLRQRLDGVTDAADQFTALYDSVEAAAAAAANAAASAEAAAAQTLGYIAQFASLDDFLVVKADNDFWPVGSVVTAGSIRLQKVTVGSDTLWIVVQSDPARTLDGYIPDAEASIRMKNLPKMDAYTVLGNQRAYARDPQMLTVLELLTLLGFVHYGDTASGAINFPASSDVPNAPTAMRTGHGTSSAGETTVTFEQEFSSSTPNVVITPIGDDASDDLHVALTANPTTSSFKFIIRDETGAAVARKYSYIAYGNGP